MKRFDLAKDLCEELGGYLESVFRSEHEEIAKKGSDFVLEADLYAEKLALGKIKEMFPEDEILSEEEGAVEGSGEYRWIIDPLDGTVNFKYGIPYFCSSVSLEYKGGLVFASVFNPLAGELFWAEKNMGAYVNDSKMTVSGVGDLKKAFVSYSTSNHEDAEVVELGSKTFKRVLNSCRAIRLRGSSLMDMCNLAKGQFDGLVKVYGNYWDYAAGKLIIEEAGGKVTDLKGKEPVGMSNILASNGVLHEDLLKVIGDERGG